MFPCEDVVDAKVDVESNVCVYGVFVLALKKVRFEL